MTKEMRTLLEQAASGDRDAEARLIEDNSGLIWSIVRRYYGRGTEPDDLYQLACVGFIKAVRGFDVSLGNEFSTYAVPKIAGEIRLSQSLCRRRTRTARSLTARLTLTAPSSRRNRRISPAILGTA